MRFRVQFLQKSASFRIFHVFRNFFRSTEVQNDVFSRRFVIFLGSLRSKNLRIFTGDFFFLLWRRKTVRFRAQFVQKLCEIDGSKVHKGPKDVISFVFRKFLHNFDRFFVILGDFRSFFRNLISFFLCWLREGVMSGPKSAFFLNFGSSFSLFWSSFSYFPTEVLLSCAMM